MRGLKYGALVALLGAAMPATPVYTVTGAIALPDGGWDYSVYDAAAQKVFIARSDAVTSVDLASQKATQLAPAARAHQVVLLPGSNTILETDGTTGTARLLDKNIGAETAKIAVGEKPDAALYDPASKTVFVVNAKSGTLSVVDPAAAKVIATITLKPGLESAAIGPKGRLYINNEDTNDMSVVDIASRKVVTVIAMPGCEEPNGIAYSKIANRLIASCSNGMAAIVNPVSAKLDKLLPIGLGPDAVMLDEARGLAFIPCGKSAVLEFLALAKSGVTSAGNMATAAGVRSGAIDLKTGTLYLPSAKYTPNPEPKGRPIQVPGSASLMIVTPAAK